MKNNRMLFRRWLITFGLFFLPFQIYGLTSQSYTSSVEWIKVYFNMPADYSQALSGNMSKSNRGLIGTLESLIESAKLSVDLAIYDLKAPDKIGQKLPRIQVVGQLSELSEPFSINISTADHAMLELLPGIGLAYTTRIISYREKTIISQILNNCGISTLLDRKRWRNYVPI